jgi:hypothetical protein
MGRVIATDVGMTTTTEKEKISMIAKTAAKRKPSAVTIVSMIASCMTGTAATTTIYRRDWPSATACLQDWSVSS